MSPNGHSEIDQCIEKGAECVFHSDLWGVSGRVFVQRLSGSAKGIERQRGLRRAVIMNEWMDWDGGGEEGDSSSSSRQFSRRRVVVRSQHWATLSIVPTSVSGLYLLCAWIPDSMIYARPSVKKVSQLGRSVVCVGLRLAIFLHMNASRIDDLRMPWTFHTFFLSFLIFAFLFPDVFILHFRTSFLFSGSFLLHLSQKYISPNTLMWLKRLLDWKPLSILTKWAVAILCTFFVLYMHWSLWFPALLCGYALCCSHEWLIFFADNSSGSSQINPIRGLAAPVLYPGLIHQPHLKNVRECTLLGFIKQWNTHSSYELRCGAVAKQSNKDKREKNSHGSRSESRHIFDWKRKLSGQTAKKAMNILLDQQIHVFKRGKNHVKRF